MELSILHIGIIFSLAILGGVFAYNEAGSHESKLILVPGFTIGAGILGFFLYYVGIFILWFIAAVLVLAALKTIFSPRIVVIEKDRTNDVYNIRKTDIEATIIEKN